MTATLDGLAGSPSRPSPQPGSRAWLCGLVPPVLALVSFAPASAGRFVSWDDTTNFVFNPDFQGLDWPRVRWAWSTFHLGVYQPLAWMVLEVQYALWGLDPRGFHLTSLLIYAVSAFVLYRLTVALLERCRDGSPDRSGWSIHLGAGLAVALFVVHPLRTEVVAWISCQPYLLCALLALLAVHAYLRAHPAGQPARAGWGLVALLLFGGALLSKAVAVSLPVVLLVLDVYPLRRVGIGTQRRVVAGRWAWSAWAEKLPYFALSLIFIVLALKARGQHSAPEEIEAVRGSLSTRIAQACYSVWFYPVKTVWPSGLIACYPPPARVAWSEPRYLVAGLAVAAVVAALVLWRRRCPGLLAGWICYLVILAPNSGLIPNTRQPVADRYGYMAMMGLVVPFAAALARRRRAMEIGVVGLAALMCLTVLSRRQCQVWRDSTALWGHAIANAERPDPLHRLKLETALLEEGRYRESLDYFLGTLRSQPGSHDSLRNLGIALMRLERLDEAEPYLAEAARVRPDDALAHASYGELLIRRGRPRQAEPHFAEAVRLRPSNPDYRCNLGVAILQQGRLDEAEATLNEALRQNPDQSNARMVLGMLELEQGRFDEAEAMFLEVLRRHPGDISVRRALARLASKRSRRPPP